MAPLSIKGIPIPRPAPPCPGPAPPYPQAALGRPSRLCLGLAWGLATRLWGSRLSGRGGLQAGSLLPAHPRGRGVAERHPEMGALVLLSRWPQRPPGARNTVLRHRTRRGLGWPPSCTQQPVFPSCSLPRPLCPGGAWGRPWDQTPGASRAGVCLPETGDGIRQPLSGAQREACLPSCPPRPCHPHIRTQCPWQAQMGLSQQGRLQPPSEDDGASAKAPRSRSLGWEARLPSDGAAVHPALALGRPLTIDVQGPLSLERQGRDVSPPKALACHLLSWPCGAGTGLRSQGAPSCGHLPAALLLPLTL